ncbi:MAG: dCTP deaminase [Candidatus Saccharimonadaceae bacterium]
MPNLEATGVYSNAQIIEAIKSGHIIQDPPAPELINGSSIDVRLGHYFYRTDTENTGKIYNPFDENDIKRYFGEVLEAQPLKELRRVEELIGKRALKNIDPEQPVILLRPHERILGHTLEFIGIRAPGTSSMQAKSTTGRNGIVVCKDAGWGDPGYFSRWTMEIQNDNDEYVPLQVGMPIAQIAFYHTGLVNGDYSTLSGNYQSTEDIEEIKRLWTPEAMLPRSNRMKVKLPPVVLGLKEGLK